MAARVRHTTVAVVCLFTCKKERGHVSEPGRSEKRKFEGKERQGERNGEIGKAAESEM